MPMLQSRQDKCALPIVSVGQPNPSLSMVVISLGLIQVETDSQFCCQYFNGIHGLYWPVSQTHILFNITRRSHSVLWKTFQRLINSSSHFNTTCNNLRDSFKRTTLTWHNDLLKWSHKDIPYSCHWWDKRSWSHRMRKHPLVINKDITR